MSTPNKVNLVIFSKDRACQLDLLLRSIEELGWDDFFQINVIAKWSNDEYRAGYEKVYLSHTCVIWDEEFYKPIQNLTYRLLSDINSPYSAFSTDDMVFYRKPEKNLFEILNDLPANGCFSLRLGYNTIVQDYHLQTRQPSLNLHILEDEILKWSPQHYHPYNNYGYPLAVDMHIYHTPKLVNWTKSFKWNNTNELETGLQRFRSEITELWSYKHSVAVNVPVNNMSGITKAGEKHAYSVEELNKEYLTGKRIDLSTILAENVVGCHQEMELDFVQST